MCVTDVVKNLNAKVFYLMSRINQTRCIEWHEMCKCRCRLDAVFVTVNNAGTKINAGVNAKNCLIKVYAVKDLFGIQVIANKNVISRVMLVSI